MSKYLKIIAISALISVAIIGLIYLSKYARQVRWEDFTKMHDYINNRNIGE